MKKIKIILFSLMCGGLIISCENDDNKFTGSPVDTMNIETITGTVSTNTTFALPGQTIDFTATLPDSFRSVVTDTVTVQATVLTLGGGIRNASVDILPGQNSATGEINVGGGGGTFDLNFNLKLTAINLKKVVLGKHFLLNSNVVNIASGNSTVPTTNDKRLKISIDWENTTIINKIKVKVERVKLTTITLRGSQGNANIKIGSSTYVATFNTDLNTTASDFVALHASTISAVNAVDVLAVGSDLQFTYYTSVPPVITITATPNTSLNLKGSTYSEVVVGAPADSPKSYFFAASKLGSTAEGVSSPTAPSSYAYTPGLYRIKIGVTNATDLAVSPVDLKYRITLRFPDGSVKIYNGVYTNLSVASGFKSVLDITKIGLGDSTTYGEPVFTP